MSGGEAERLVRRRRGGRPPPRRRGGGPRRRETRRRARGPFGPEGVRGLGRRESKEVAEAREERSHARGAGRWGPQNPATICLSSSILACFGLLGSELGRFDGYAFRVIALACARVAMASPACLAIVLLRDVLRAITASALVIFAELWSVVLLVHPYISPSGDLAQGLPPQLLVHPAVALKMAVLPGATMGQVPLIVCPCIGISVVVFLFVQAIWSRAELR